ncbi:MAG: sugar ABC transporter ATP-binding protein [Bifidobacteriaceae bacterium]|jgi:erythritol transport system ATP-binding protein|nr:sugar ABC transporter ATP-binding protein [Bifidobacteriaceae bacterium]
MNPAASDVILRAEHITKVYGGTNALRGVDFDVRRGKVTTLIGENGAGKSTLMRILAGVERPTAGRVTLEGAEVHFASPTEAVARGVAIIHQELSLCPNLSVVDNVFLAREAKRGPWVNRGVERERVSELLERLEEPIDPDTMVGNLRMGQQQLVEIARALSQDTRVLVMDEPTSALSAVEVEALFRVIRDLTARGVSIIYISHHLDECLEIGDHAVILRDGLVAAQAETKDIDLSWIVSQMIGREEDELYSDLPSSPGEDVLEVSHLKVADPDNPGRVAVDDVSITVRAGEVVGVYGLMGAGRTELLETIAGRNVAQEGTITLAGRRIDHSSIGDRIRAGLALAPEDRQRDGLVQSLSVARNMSLSSLPSITRRGLVSRSKERDLVARVSADTRVKTSSQEAPIGSLSGGNQQKVVVGKALMTEPKALILDEPTRGIDVGAKADMFSLMAASARRGAAILFATSEVSEVLNAADRVLVMSRGRITADLDPAATSREEIMAAADDAATRQETAGQ